MAILVLDRSGLELRADGEALAVYLDGTREGTVPLRLLDRLALVGSSIKLDTGVLARLGEAGVAVVVLSGRNGRRMSLALGPRHNDAAIRIAQLRASIDPEQASAWAARVVRLKVRGQRRAAASAASDRPDLRKPLWDCRRSLARVSRSLRREALSAESARGLEGAAAAAWFKAFVTLFPPELGFTGRNRRPPRDPVNAVLSLSYTLLTVEAVRQCHVVGLDPMIGLFHQPDFGRESLACDLVEPFRPMADLWVWKLFRERVLRADQFSTGPDGCHLTKAGRAKFYAEYEAAAEAWRPELGRACTALVRRLRGEDEAALDPALLSLDDIATAAGEPA
jgi:CRISPR-associated protein Cas1